MGEERVAVGGGSVQVMRILRACLRVLSALACVRAKRGCVSLRVGVRTHVQLLLLAHVRSPMNNVLVDATCACCTLR